MPDRTSVRPSAAVISFRSVHLEFVANTRLRAMLERERQERLKAMGNSIVPQIVELIGRQVMVLENMPSVG